MNEMQPKRPPRMPRAFSKESSNGLLMSVIRSLTSTKDVDERDKEKAKLEKQFEESDSKLDQLVIFHHSDLTNVLQAFTVITNTLNTSIEKLKVTKENIINCKDMLRYKKDELRKLWIESIENKYVLNLLDEIEHVSKVPNEIENFIKNKHYLHATKLLINSIKSLKSNLENVEALKEVKSTLIQKQETLYNLIIEELHKHIYVRSTKNALKKIKRSASDRKKTNFETSPPTRRVSVADILSPALIQSTALSRRRSMTALTITNDHSDENVLEEDLSNEDPENDSKYFIAILIECLFLLDKIPEALESIKNGIEKELINIAKRTSKKLYLNYIKSSSNLNSNLNTSNSPVTINLRSFYILKNSSHKAHLLEDLCELLFQQFRTVFFYHENVVLPNLRRVESKMFEKKDQLNFYSIHDIWSKIQLVLQLLTDIYLDVIGGNLVEKNITNTSSSQTKNQTINDSNTSVAELNSYFIRKKPALSVAVGSTFNKIKKNPLFKFESSSHAISLNAYLQEQKEAIKEKTEKSESTTIDSIDVSINEADQYIVCEPCPENIVILFNPLMKFISEIDYELNLEENNHCQLYSYMISGVKLFLSQVKIDIERILDCATKSLDSWRIISDTDFLTRKNQNRPILQSTLIIEKASQDLKELMLALPMYADDFLSFICNILSNYKEACFSAYKAIVQTESEEKKIISATWAKDEEISRSLKNLPNWPSYQRKQKNFTSTHLTNTNFLHNTNLESIGLSMTFDESPEDIRLRNKRESEMLLSNLGQDTLIPANEILCDINQLKILGQLQESMEWLSCQIQNLFNALPKTQSSDNNLLNASNFYQNFKVPSTQSIEIIHFSEVSLAALNQLANDFEELSEICLLVLHLELRIHCYYYLNRVTSQSNFAMGIDTQEPDIEVVQVNKDISSIDEVLSITLQPWKLKYIFEGVGHLVATILINGSSKIKRINQNGVKKMCRNIFAIQQNLTSITMSREVDLDFARQYFELFYLTPEEILASIEERGPQFQVQDYANAINLLHRSNPASNFSKLQHNIKRLNEILNQAAISV